MATLLVTALLPNRGGCVGPGIRLMTTFGVPLIGDNSQSVVTTHGMCCGCGLCLRSTHSGLPCAPIIIMCGLRCTLEPARQSRLARCPSNLQRAEWHWVAPIMGHLVPLCLHRSCHMPAGRCSRQPTAVGCQPVLHACAVVPCTCSEVQTLNNRGYMLTGGRHKACRPGEYFDVIHHSAALAAVGAVLSFR